MITDKRNFIELPVREAISYVFEDFRLDVKRQELQKAGNPVPLTNKAYRVLFLLVQNSEQTVEKEHIYKELWGDSFVEDANLTQHIYILRKTLGQNSNGESYIETVSRTGYRFTVPVHAVYPPQIAEAFFKPKTGIEPALDPGPRLTVKPHLQLADTNRYEENDAEQITAAPAGQESPSSGRRPSKRVIIILGLLAALAATLIGVLIYNRSAPAPVGPIRSVAVLPFKPIGDETRNERLGLGMADAIITNLTKMRQIPVRPTSSVIRYIDLPQNNSVAAGSELGVDTVVEGTVQLADERVRVSVQLIDVSGGKAIWAENFDEPFTGIFQVQDSISQRIVRSIAANLKQTEKTSGGSTTNLEAMKAYQLGVYYHSTRTKENLFKAEELFKEAVANDPNFAKAYAMLADTYNMQRYYRFADPMDTRAKGFDAASRALEIDSSTAEAYIAMANLQVGGKDGRAGSKRMLEKAIELSPYNSTAHLRYAWVIIEDDLKAASEEMRLAQEYDPVSPISNGAYCNMLLFERRFREAIPFCEKASALNPTLDSSREMLTDAYMLAGRVDEAIASTNQRIERNAGNDRLVAEASLAFYLLKAGRRGEADTIISKLKREAEKVPELSNELSVLMFEIGEREAGVKYFKRAYDQRILHLAMVDHYPIWEKVRADVEVQKILAEPPAAPSRPSPIPAR